MAHPLTTTSILQCTMGITPSPLNILFGTIMMNHLPAVKITDSLPITNIPPFGMCTNKANPAVIAAIASSLGAVQTAPCVPLPSPWISTSPKITLNSMAIVTDSSEKLCYPGGRITGKSLHQMINIK